MLDVGPPDAWDNFYVLPERVIFKDSSWHMWYSGWDGHNATGAGMGYATSRDGVNWKKHHSNPVLLMTPGSWEEPRDSYQGYVLYNGSAYDMWYTGGNTRIGHARSKDGIRWKKTETAVLDIGPSEWDGGWVANPSILGPDPTGKFKMWYQGSDASRIRSHIGYAIGTDGKTWTKHPDAVLTAGISGSWEAHRIHSPTVLWNGEFYEMWYAGERGVGWHTYRTAYAMSLDGLNWTKSPENPFLPLGQTGSWDDEAAFVGDVMFDGKMYSMWYADNCKDSVQLVAPRE